ncbi:protein SIEVE ELEMENT OCCLUSION B-like [Rhodamnia argentea]|uniref:Protein SIEVE ELEMENT OCCLUSION B-like n=1 Tax=Rhodamnia argentea TaxID=178133 RepID=A0A8B8PHQ1_9MYRT|nr:protein SIEVE ELEMENT OCCLUSION B-like [Rhodamnia argentea]XP_048128406.1 protein SIEVE ELEMENT OCCLUSION B-like [Rhodamnia argentea]
MATILAHLLGMDHKGKPHQIDQSMWTNLLASFDDEKFMKEMVNAHAPEEGDVDVQSLFHLVDNTLHGTTAIVDSIVNPKGTQGSGSPEFKPLKEGFNPPLAAINEVGCQLTCKALDTKNVRQTLVSLFHELSSYSWVNKALITLSSLAVFYGDFWRLARVEPSDKLAESMAILKGLPAITKPSDPQKIQIFGVLNEMIKTTLNMTQCIVDFEHDSKDVPELSTMIDVASSVYQIIISVLACSIQFTSLISTVDDNKGKDLPSFARKVNMIHHTIKRQYEDFLQKKEEIKEYQRLQRLFNAPTDNVELIKAMFYIKDDPQPLFIGSKKTRDKVESLRRKNVMLLISDLKLTSHDLSILIKIYNERKFHEERYEIVWVPVIEQEGEEVIKQFQNLQLQMPWYSVHSPKLINRVAIRIIKEKWHFRQDTMVTVLDPQGKVSNPNAMNTIRVWGWEAFPFTGEIVVDKWARPGISWFDLLVTDLIFPKIQEAIKAEKYIFLYGAEEPKVIQEIEESLKKMIDDGFSMVAFNVTKSQLFWTRLESCMLSKLQTRADLHEPLMQDIIRLYTNFKKDGGFAVLTKGSRVVINESHVYVTKVLVQYEAWKKLVNVNGKTFDMVFKEQFDRIYVLPRCHHFYIPNMVGYIPEDVKCPVCPRMMNNIVKFECCHGAH